MERKLVNLCRQGNSTKEEFIKELVRISTEIKISRPSIAVFNDGTVITVSSYSTETDIENALQHVENNPHLKMSGEI